MVFNKKSIAVFNNTLFNAEEFRMSQIHETVERLYEAASKLRNVNGQSAVARLLGNSPQTVKNWEQRGLSMEGALAAQKIIGCDANWLLGTQEQLDKPRWTPHAIGARDSEATYSVFKEWPFRRINPYKIAALSSDDKLRLETLVELSAATLKIDITIDEANEKSA